jgi:hypothetical protein
LREVSVGYDYGKGGVTVGVGALAGTKEYEAATIFDQDIVSGTVDVAIDIGTSWKVGMAAQYTRVEYTQSVRVDENLDAGMSVERRLTGQFWIYADVMREERKSTENGQNYTANRVTLQIRFNPR